MSEQLVRAMDGSLIGWHTGPPAQRYLIRQLARLPRFAGATVEPFSVLRHSLHVARILEAQELPPGIVAAGLMHDAAEVLTGDVPSPFKPPEWRELERVWVERASLEYGLGIDWAEAWAMVHLADGIALHSEGHKLMRCGDWKPAPGVLPLLAGVLSMSGYRVEVEAERILSRPRCHAGRDGDCIWEHCPQLRDKEPESTHRHCPLDREHNDEV